MEPKKSLGQHWLNDQEVLQDIVDLADIQPGDTVVEVGPGLGTLTRPLLDAGANVVSVEFDQSLYENLEKRGMELFGKKNLERLTLVNEDILRFRFDLMEAGYKVVANIPYYLTSNLIRLLASGPKKPELIVLLIQKEVADRLCAGPGEMSLLSFWAQIYYDCELGPLVPAKLFTPPPKVDSEVVVMTLRKTPLVEDVDEKALSKVVQAGFSNKRKTLHNSLAAGLQLGKDEAGELLKSAGVDPTSRPQELDHASWEKIVKYYLTR